jgi:excisionase family DNA binding protein
MSVEKIEPISLPAAEEAQVRALSDLLHRESKPRLVGHPGEPSLELPDAVYALLVKVVDRLQQGDAVSVVPVAKDLTTQQAAAFLGVSRPFLVKLLRNQAIPYHTAGTHRRVLLNDLLAYKEQRDRLRLDALDRMSREADEAGVYDRVLLPAS